MTFNYLQSYVKMPVSTGSYIPTSLSHEQAATTNIVSLLRILLFTDEEGVANTCMEPKKSPSKD